MHFAVGIIIPKQFENNKQKYIDKTMEEFSIENETNREFDISIRHKQFKKEAKKIIDDLVNDENTTIDTLFSTIKTYKDLFANKRYKSILIDHYRYQEHNNNLGHFFNPKAFYDWYVIGGRWDGWLTSNPHKTHGGFNFGAECRDIENNTITIKKYKQLPKDKQLHHIVTTNAEYYEKEFDNDDDTQIMNLINKENDDNLICCLDCHI